MSFSDLFALVIENLNRRKARVALTAVGVVIGTAAIVVLVSLAIGLQRNATEQLWGIGDLTQITVEPAYGEFGPGGPVVVDIGPGGVPGRAQPQQTIITNKTIQDLANISGVVSVIPKDFLRGGGLLKFNRLETYVGIIGIGLQDLSQLGLKPQAGSLGLERGAAVVGFTIPNSFYDTRPQPGQEPPPAPDLLGQQLKLILIKHDNEQNEIRKTLQIRINGIIAESRTEADWSIYMPLEDITTYNEWFQGRRINRNRDGYQMVIVKVAEVSNVLDIADQIKAMGYQAYTPQSFVQGINSFYIVLQVIFGGVGAIALLVAAIGIANTMAMAILERTREIGLMKAIGATNRDVLTVFLGEAAGIGFLGGLGGVLLGWSAGQVINVMALAYFAGQSVQTGAPPPSVAVYTPSWLPIFALTFATIIGLTSGLYPALRAATMIPVQALKYE